MKRKIFLLLAMIIGSTGFVFAKTIKVVATLTDLKSIAEFVGGNKVAVSSIATGYQNPHFVDPKPSYIIGLSSADLFITVGLGSGNWMVTTIVSKLP